MAYFDVIYKYMTSEWPVEINQCDIPMATHYDIKLGNDAHCEIIVGNDVQGMSIVMSQ